MNRSKKILLGLATIWPLIYLVFVVIFLATIAFLPAAQSPFPVVRSPELLLGRSLGLFLLLHFLTIFWATGLVIFYISHAVRNRQLSNDMRLLWASLIFVGNLITMPIYWYLCIWKTPRSFRR